MKQEEKMKKALILCVSLLMTLALGAQAEIAPSDIEWITYICAPDYNYARDYDELGEKLTALAEPFIDEYEEEMLAFSEGLLDAVKALGADCYVCFFAEDVFWTDNYKETRKIPEQLTHDFSVGELRVVKIHYEEGTYSFYLATDDETLQFWLEYPAGDKKSLYKDSIICDDWYWHAPIHYIKPE